MTTEQIEPQVAVQTPQWVRDAIFYQIFPDRFAKSDKVHKPHNLEPWFATPTFHGYKGGDLLGVVEHLDYLSDLGINAIYFNPVFQSASNHRYHTFDYYNVDPMLGGNDALRALLDACHARGIKVILDGVFNHASRGFFQFNDILENGPFSAYIDWFTVRGWPLNAYDESKPPNYDAWWQLHALPKFNIYNPDVREYLLSVGEYWIKFGIDGWRLDVPAEINDDNFWQEFRRRVKAANPDAYIVGEIWHDARRWLQGDQFDAVMNYLFTKLCIEFFIGEPLDGSLLQGSSLWPVRHVTANEFGGEVEALIKLYPPEVTEVQLNLLDSHDTARFLTVARGDVSALLMATLFQMVYPGAPCIYYGDEIGMSGGKDPLNRAGFPWESDMWENGVRNFFKKCVALRRDHPSTRHGAFRTLYCQGSLYAVARNLGDDLVIAAFNVGQSPEELELSTEGLMSDGVLVDVLSGEQYTVHGGSLHGRVAPRSAVALEVLSPTALTASS